MRALVLSGGGARGAYQVGVLKALGEITHELKLKNPFQIFTGVSAGAINASFLAAGADNFYEQTQSLEKLWSELGMDRVFKTDALSLSRIGLKWMSELSIGALTGTTATRALLDTSPLRDLIESTLDPERIQHLLETEELKALALTALDYRTSMAVTFVQGHPLLPNWHRSRRKSFKTQITASHVMASSAIPLLFPPIEVEDSYFGDGCVRNLTPLSPAIHLGANKLFTIGVRRVSYTADDERAMKSRGQPSVARVANAILNAVLLDGIETDIERLRRVNDFLKKVPAEHLPNMNFSPIDTVWVHPLGDIGALANKMSSRLPRMIRFLLKGLGPLEDASEIISYLLFDSDFCKRLIHMGYEDGLQQTEEIRLFLK